MSGEAQGAAVGDEVLVGYDGSPDASAAIAVGAKLLPRAVARIVTFWAPPYTSRALRADLLRRSASVEELTEAIVDEGQAEAERTVSDGAAIAAAAGWTVTAAAVRDYAGEGFAFARMAEQRSAAAIVVGSRGLSGVRAAMGSVSDTVVHYSPVPVLVVPRPLVTAVREAAEGGPIVVADDGSSGAANAVAAAARLFPDRSFVVVTVGTGDAEATGDVVLADAGVADAERVQVAPVGVAGSGRAIADALAGVADDRGAAAIVVGSRGRALHKQLLLGSVAMAVLHHARRPVVVVPPPDRLAVS